MKLIRLYYSDMFEIEFHLGIFKTEKSLKDFLIKYIKQKEIGVDDIIIDIRNNKTKKEYVIECLIHNKSVSRYLYGFYYEIIDTKNLK